MNRKISCVIGEAGKHLWQEVLSIPDSGLVHALSSEYLSDIGHVACDGDGNFAAIIIDHFYLGKIANVGAKMPRKSQLTTRGRKKFTIKMGSHQEPALLLLLLISNTPASSNSTVLSV